MTFEMQCFIIIRTSTGSPIGCSSEIAVKSATVLILVDLNVDGELTATLPLGFLLNDILPLPSSVVLLPIVPTAATLDFLRLGVRV